MVARGRQWRGRRVWISGLYGEMRLGLGLGLERERKCKVRSLCGDFFSFESGDGGINWVFKVFVL